MSEVKIIRLKTKAIPYQVRCLIGDYIKERLYLFHIDQDAIPDPVLYWYHSKYIIAVKNDMAVGFVAYFEDENGVDLNIQVAFVEEGFRRQGIFNKMYSFLRRYAKNQGIAYISSGIFTEANHKDGKTFNRKPIAVSVREYLRD